jgi:hypothetical protein
VRTEDAGARSLRPAGGEFPGTAASSMVRT